MDIHIPIDYAIIVGGNLTHIKSYSASDIKQMLGRFRKGVENIFVIKENSKLRQQDVNNINSKLRMYSERFDNCKDQTKLTAINDFLNMLQAQNKLDAMHGWESFKAFQRMMNEYPEFEIGTVYISHNPEKAKKTQIYNIRQVQRSVLNGIDPMTLDFKYRKVCKRYIDAKGMEAFKNASRCEIKRYIKLIDAADCENTMFATMEPSELFDIFLSNDIYTHQYLTDVLHFIGHEIKQELSIEVSNVFGCICLQLTSDVRPQRNTYLIINVPSNSIFWENAFNRKHKNFFPENTF